MQTGDDAVAVRQRRPLAGREGEHLLPTNPDSGLMIADDRPFRASRRAQAAAIAAFRVEPERFVIQRPSAFREMSTQALQDAVALSAWTQRSPSKAGRVVSRSMSSRRSFSMPHVSAFYYQPGPEPGTYGAGAPQGAGFSGCIRASISSTLGRGSSRISARRSRNAST